MSNVLVVEDDLINRVILSKIISSVDATTKLSWATSLDEAKSILNKEPLDLVISDFLLFGLGTGLDLWQICQTDHPGVRFMMISGLSAEVMNKLSQQTKKNFSYLKKPFPFEECQRLISELLNQR